MRTDMGCVLVRCLHRDLADERKGAKWHYWIYHDGKPTTNVDLKDTNTTPNNKEAGGLIKR